MLNKLSVLFHRWARGWLVIVLFLVYGFFAGYLMPRMAGLMNSAANQSVLPLDLMFFYTPEQAFDMMNKYGEAGRSVYFNIELTADIIYPIASMSFFSSLLSWLFQRGFKADSKMQKFNIVPAGSWFFDLIENAAIVPMILMYPARSSTLAWLAMILGLVKWGFAFLSLGLVLIGLVKAAQNRFRKQQ
jgi:hypothetical protein